MMLQFRYLDARLRFSEIAPHLSQIQGGQFTRDLIWTPTVYASNEGSSAVIGNSAKDLLISIDPSGMVTMNTRSVFSVLILCKIFFTFLSNQHYCY